MYIYMNLFICLSLCVPSLTHSLLYICWYAMVSRSMSALVCDVMCMDYCVATQTWVRERVPLFDFCFLSQNRKSDRPHTLLWSPLLSIFLHLYIDMCVYIYMEDLYLVCGDPFMRTVPGSSPNSRSNLGPPPKIEQELPPQKSPERRGHLLFGKVSTESTVT